MDAISKPAPSITTAAETAKRLTTAGPIILAAATSSVNPPASITAPLPIEDHPIVCNNCIATASGINDVERTNIAAANANIEVGSTFIIDIKATAPTNA